jgi:hypothetical protein
VHDVVLAERGERAHQAQIVAPTLEADDALVELRVLHSVQQLLEQPARRKPCCLDRTDIEIP